MSDPPPPGTVPVFDDATAEQRGIIVGLAAAGVSEAVLVALQAAQRNGVELPDGFAERLAAAVARRCVPTLRRLATSAMRLGARHDEAVGGARAEAKAREGGG